ncbi:head decoration protein [Desulfoluna spongiiphila]|uniref:Bacteriophage lambda head decoration protein D n=1 Tax=Desulfoluna spongiiphila TaxID=419481 RepID=A0A1G5G062_9BACT|nr:head decoration protein [Desulfoluna spongiiphila]SCY44799.1 Bacteriophage lambda head decoration protein D [Desulfoluna spongiiphila]
MTAFTEPNNLKDFLVWEQERGYSREEVTLTGTAVKLAQVVGKVTASGKHAAFNQDGSDGTETAAGIAIANYDASAADVRGVVIARDAIITASNLVWPADIDAGEIAAALATLKTLGIIVREES